MANDKDNDASNLSPTSIVIKQTGLPSTLKGHAQRLLMRWLAGALANPYFQTIRDNLDTMEGRSRVSMMMAEEVGRQAIADPEQLERAKARFLSEVSRKQGNVEAIASLTAEKIEEAPTSSTPEPSAEPSPDWMNAFTREAEDASSDELRERLASILAGEIQKPGTFSRSTLRLIGEIDREILIKFQEVLQNRIGNRVYAPDEWSSGRMYLIGLEMLEHGLINSNMSSNSFTISDSKKEAITGNEYGVVVTFSDRVIANSFQIWTLSRSGLEISNLLEKNDERIPLKLLASKMNKTGIEEIYLGKIVEQIDTSKVIRQEITLFPDDIASRRKSITTHDSKFKFGL